MRKDNALSGKWFLLIKNYLGGYVRKRLKDRGDSSVISNFGIGRKVLCLKDWMNRLLTNWERASRE